MPGLAGLTQTASVLKDSALLCAWPSSGLNPPIQSTLRAGAPLCPQIAQSCSWVGPIHRLLQTASIALPLVLVLVLHAFHPGPPLADCYFLARVVKENNPTLPVIVRASERDYLIHLLPESRAARVRCSAPSARIPERASSSTAAGRRKGTRSIGMVGKFT